MIPRFLLAGAVALAIPTALPATTPVAQSAARIIQMDHISVEVIGEGSPVILIPGLSSPRAVWDGVAPDLAKRHRVYLVQVNGFGGDAPRANLQPGLLDGIVADLDAMIAAEKLKGAAVIGHSMGGLAGLMFARAHPDHLGKLMIVDALPFFSVLMAPPGSEVTAASMEPRAAAMRSQIAASYGKPVDKAAVAANVASLSLKPESRAKTEKWTMAADPRVTAQALYEDLTTDLRADLPKIAVPVTVVYAWNDAYPTRDMANTFFRAQYAGAANVKFVGVGDSAHFVMLDQPAAFAAALTEFLD